MLLDVEIVCNVLYMKHLIKHITFLISKEVLVWFYSKIWNLDSSNIFSDLNFSIPGKFYFTREVKIRRVHNRGSHLCPIIIRSCLVVRIWVKEWEWKDYFFYFHVWLSL